MATSAAVSNSAVSAQVAQDDAEEYGPQPLSKLEVRTLRYNFEFYRFIIFNNL